MSEPQTQGPSRQVRKRRVFYIPGYDPIHPRRYRELYRKEGTAQALISGYELGLKGKAAGHGLYGWHVAAKFDGATVHADVDVLVWSDIVRASMDQGIIGTYLQLLHTVWVYNSTGALFRLMRLRKGPVIAALYPICMLLLQLAVACALGWAMQGGVAYFLPIWAGWLAGGAMVVLMLRLFRRHDNRVFAYYLMHDFAFAARHRGENTPELEARMTAFRLTITEAMASDVDEVLVVGHSSGAHLAVSILADMIRAGLPDRGGDGGPALSFLSLGHVVPMVSFLPRAWRLRADLNYLAARDELTWVDVSAPGDGCAFALCDPVAVSGVAPEGKRWPLVLSAAFTQTLAPKTWKALRWRFFRLHFQYLCAFDRPGDYDYFQITAGPMTLGDRFALRRASKNRIEKAVSRYTSMAA